MLHGDENIVVQNDRRPLYLRTADALRSSIDRDYPVGSLLPSEEELASRLGVGRSSIREAMMHLESERVVVRQRGVGTIVVSKPFAMELGLEVLEPLEQLAERQGVAVETLDVEITTRRASSDEAARLDLEPGSMVVWTQRTKVTAKCPLAVMASVVPERLVSEAELRDAWKGGGWASLTALFFEWGLCAIARSEITIARADESLAKRLQLEVGEPLIQITELTVDREGRPTAWNHNYFVPGLFRLEFLRRPSRSGA